MVFHNLWDNSGTQASATLLSLARLSEKTCDETIMSGICLDRHLKNHAFVRKCIFSILRHTEPHSF